MARAEVLNVPLDAARLQHEILRERRDAVIQQRVGVGAAVVEDSILPCGRAAGGEERGFGLVPDFGDGKVGNERGDVAVEDIFGVGYAELAVALYCRQSRRSVSLEETMFAEQKP